jgi:hypothetical protein
MRRPLQHELRCLQVLHKPLSGDRRQHVVGMVHSLAALVERCERQGLGDLICGGWAKGRGGGHSGSDPEHADNPERSPGYRERIGEYWWLGQEADRRESAWTGMHDEKAMESTSVMRTITLGQLRSSAMSCGACSHFCLTSSDVTFFHSERTKPSA